MSKFKRKFTQVDSKKFLDCFVSKENNAANLYTESLSQKKLSKITANVLGNCQNNEVEGFIGEIPKVLENLHRRESLCQAHNFQKMRSAKLKIVNPDLLQQEYQALIERYKKIKGKCLMTPCRIPRSGLNILPK